MNINYVSFKHHHFCNECFILFFQGLENALKQPLLDQSGNACPSVDDPMKADEITSPLTVIEPQIEERLQLREARNVRNTFTNSSASGVMNNEHNSSPAEGYKNGTSNTSSLAADSSYAIGDRKVFGHAQVRIFKVNKIFKLSMSISIIQESSTITEFIG